MDLAAARNDRARVRFYTEYMHLFHATDRRTGNTVAGDPSRLTRVLCVHHAQWVRDSDGWRLFRLPELKQMSPVSEGMHVWEYTKQRQEQQQSVQHEGEQHQAQHQQQQQEKQQQQQGGTDKQGS